ncbi:MAG: dihydroorotate dehydrogenase (quinone) [Candidatus Levybacteria bacterium RIFCSPHIGHO2_01_FULL_36_15]|nr:MAG: dihydroorotate dehydrogenase (quinone) [Candidatus Levybacteria bacterium RIFCSPHIGHO2_01_FULL_36_15]OGH38499.1 MAG: dihydroorotate dehydrogenase (quinone) [Candidatus Levybacteria bacterium RIFCSPLOWO2_01_FULL_36_10]
MKNITTPFISVFYKNVTKRIFFLFDPEFVHERITSTGEKLGRNSLSKYLLKFIFDYKNSVLEQRLMGIHFKNPIGLSAGFDYNANLTRILPSLSFGFETIGTITNKPYGGNLPPRLGRLIKSRSLLVNKGFKNTGIDAILKKLKNENFEIPIGISIGRTNTKNLVTQEQSIEDILTAFKKVEKSKTPFSYYELNISCPNLVGNISFYPPRNLEELLRGISKLRSSKPLLIKMPIEKSNEDVLKMLDVIVKFPVQGVIFGNLQKNRNDPSINQDEAKKFTRGYFSGKPTEKRSNELIRLAYKKYGKKLIIIGCGGVFCAQDAYKKIKLGASLVQLITGLVFEGPQLVLQVNMGIAKLLEKDGYKNISEAVGKEA